MLADPSADCPMAFPRTLALVLPTILLGSVPAAMPLRAAPIEVVVDQAKLAKVPDHVATIVIGNPLIADVALQPGGIMVITGKGYGTTNLVALDKSGNVLLDQLVQVQGARDGLVVYRGADRESYSCTPTCEQRIMVGDGRTFFDNALSETNLLSSAAAGASAPK